jgi:hypothetical protein
MAAAALLQVAPLHVVRGVLPPLMPRHPSNEYSLEYGILDRHLHRQPQYVP